MSVVDSYLFEIGWIFFAVWSLIVAGFLVAAFGRDVVLALAERGRAESKDACRVVDAARAK